MCDGVYLSIYCISFHILKDYFNTFLKKLFISLANLSIKVFDSVFLYFLRFPEILEISIIYLWYITNVFIQFVGVLFIVIFSWKWFLKNYELTLSFFVLLYLCFEQLSVESSFKDFVCPLECPFVCSSPIQTFPTAK